MKVFPLAGAGVLLFLLTANLMADELLLERGTLILNGSDPLQVNYCAVPTAVDWNNDGKKDLVVGRHTSGNILLFLNQGTDLNPVFDGGSFLESDGIPIKTSEG